MKVNVRNMIIPILILMTKYSKGYSYERTHEKEMLKNSEKLVRSYHDNLNKTST